MRDATESSTPSQPDQFLINLQRFARGDVPAASAKEVAVLDQQMNDLYRRIMAAQGEFPGTVRKEGVRNTQRAWLKLRDAWLAFAPAAYPRVSPETVQAQLIRLRLNQLQQLGVPSPLIFPGPPASAAPQQE